MTLLHEAVEAKKFDTRMVERNLSRGVVAVEDVEKIVKKLPDDSENAEYISLETLIAQQSPEDDDDDRDHGQSAPQAQHAQPGTSH